MTKQEYDRQYYLMNKEKISEQTKIYYSENREEVRAYRKRWYEKNKTVILDRNRFKKYQMTDIEYVDMLFRQNHVCAICEQPCGTKRKLSVDHDHSCCSTTPTCGKCTRGLLCQACNTSLGGFRDSRSIVQKADQYLGKYE